MEANTSKYYHSGRRPSEDFAFKISEYDVPIETIKYATSTTTTTPNDDGKGKSGGFMNNVVNKIEKKQRSFTTGGFASSVGINGLVNGMRDKYAEFNDNNNNNSDNKNGSRSSGTNSRNNDRTLKRCLSEPAVGKGSKIQDGNSEEGESSKASSKEGSESSKASTKSGKSLPLAKNFIAIKEKISPTNIKFPPGLSNIRNLKNSFVGSRKSSLPTYVSANIRRGSDVKSLVEEDNVWPTSYDVEQITDTTAGDVVTTSSSFSSSR